MIRGRISQNKLSCRIKTYNGTAGSDVLVPKLINANGTYLPVNDGADGYSSVTVDVRGDNTSFVIKEKDNILKYNKVYLNDVWSVYSQNTTTQQRLEHLQNGSFLTGSGSIWKMNNGVIQPNATSWSYGMTFTQPITLTTETTFSIRFSYSTSSTWRNFWVSLWENVDPSTILTQSFGTGNLASDPDSTYSLITPSSPTQASSTVFSVDVSALQGKTIWIHLFTTDVIPLISEVWFE